MKRLVYLAGRYSRREELCQYREQLFHLHRWTCTSRWLDGSHALDTNGASIQASDSERERFALEDWNDLRRADVCISFTEAPRSTNSRGGRHVEFGAALGMNKQCVVIGPRENVFHHLPGVHWYPDWTMFTVHWFGHEKPGER